VGGGEEKKMRRKRRRRRRGNNNCAKMFSLFTAGTLPNVCQRQGPWMYFLYKNEYKIFKPAEVAIRRGLR
jgi:hypothetical protein